MMTVTSDGAMCQINGGDHSRNKSTKTEKRSFIQPVQPLQRYTSK